MDLIHIIDGLIGIVVVGCGWLLGTQARELKRVEILLNKTREDYAKRDDVVNTINRLEEKVDRILERLKWAELENK